MKRFQYLEPESLDEAVSLLLKYGGKVKVLAGGTDLVLLMRQRKITPVYVVDIKKIPNLKYIKYNTRNGMRIGALITYREITESLPVRDHYSALAEAVNKIGSIQTRNRGTIGGNLCNASPTSEPAIALIAFGAGFKIAGPKGERWVAADEFFKGPGKTALRKSELLTEIHIPNPRKRTGAAFARQARGAIDTSLVNAAATVVLGRIEAICADVRIALGAVASKPIRAKRAERSLKDRTLTPEAIANTALIASREAKPTDHRRCTAEYRRELVKVLTKRVLCRALEEAKTK